jgi:hemerythrin-like domain-containing protein
MKSIQDLAAEHLTAERMLCLLECIAGRIEAGQAVDPNDPSAIIEFFQIYCERSHYAKEERKLFVAIESAGLRDYRETIADLIRDHSQSRHLVGNMGTAARRFSAGEVAAGQEFAAMAHEYVALMRGHIRREEETLFPLAEANLSAEQDQNFLVVFGRMDARELGPARVAAIDALLARLEAAYPA